MIDYKEALKQLLIGLECQSVDEFISKCTVRDCRNLGKVYSLAVKGKLKESHGED